MSKEDNKAIVGRWFTEFWGKDYNPAVIDELAAPDIRFEYSLHAFDDMPVGALPANTGSPAPPS